MDGKIYFAADFHLGLDGPDFTSRQREIIICNWLSEISKDAREIFLLGDLFDFWFEYNKVVPKGHTRFLGKLAELSDAGIPITIFTGNHDLWMFGYFEEELGIPVKKKPIFRSWNNKKFLLGHGDGLGPGDYSYKRLKKIFTNPLCQWMFARIHPNFGIRMANFWSAQSRKKSERPEFLGKEKEWLIHYCENQLKEKPEMDYFIFGHRHLPIKQLLSNGKSYYFNTGEWIGQFSYLEFDGQAVRLKFYKPTSEQPPTSPTNK